MREQIKEKELRKEEEKHFSLTVASVVSAASVHPSAKFLLYFHCLFQNPIDVQTDSRDRKLLSKTVQHFSTSAVSDAVC